MRGQHLILQKLQLRTVLGKLGKRLCHGFRQHDAAIQPIRDALGGLLAGRIDIFRHRFGGDPMLKAVDIIRKARKGGDDKR